MELSAEQQTQVLLFASRRLFGDDALLSVDQDAVAVARPGEEPLRAATRDELAWRLASALRARAAHDAALANNLERLFAPIRRTFSPEGL